MKSNVRRSAVALIASLTVLIPSVALAANTPNLTQTVNAGVISADIKDGSGNTVASPSVAFPALNVSFNCQTNTATLGNASNRLYVTNFADMTGKSGWTLTMAATGGAATTWSDGNHSYKYNDATGSGCTNGQMTVDPSVGTITLDCSSACTSTGVTKGASTAFSSGVADSVTLINSTNTSAWEGYLTGVSLSQKVPSSQPSGDYSLGMTLTATAQ